MFSSDISHANQTSPIQYPILGDLQVERSGPRILIASLLRGNRMGWVSDEMEMQTAQCVLHISCCVVFIGDLACMRPVCSKQCKECLSDLNVHTLFAEKISSERLVR